MKHTDSSATGATGCTTDAAASSGWSKSWECDLIMKGGITSGVVYPRAIQEIAKTFRLRSIGGTSAGAIAAACAAAAELGRQRYLEGKIPRDPEGFAALGELPGTLSETLGNGRGTRLLGFFKPARPMQKAFRIFTGAMQHHGTSQRAPQGIKLGAARVAKALWVLVSDNLWAILALTLAVGAALAGALHWMDGGFGAVSHWLWLVATPVPVAFASVAGCILLRAVRALPGNFYGICSGMPEADDAHPEEALTLWLEKYLDMLSGQDQLHASDRPREPLTFGDLQKHGIDLQMMTTSLTFGRPFRLPFGHSSAVRENGLFALKKSDLPRLFPPAIVDWLHAKERPPHKNDYLHDADMDGFLRLPYPEQMPVLMAVRMSLSFPLLLSAVPLYSLDHRQRVKGADALQPLRVCWFTDGGVGSNFPIHFFDAALPTRPTFGLDLGKASAEIGDTPKERVRFPETNSDAHLSQWWTFERETGLQAIWKLLARIVGVAKDWNHDALAVMPGFRDRICTILLKQNEGGLNLTMPRELIQMLGQYGELSGRRFVEAYGPQPAGAPQPNIGWSNHQLVRQRMLLATLSETLLQIESTVRDSAKSPESYLRFFAAKGAPRKYRYLRNGGLGIDQQTGLYRSQAGLSRWLLKELSRLGLALRRHIDAQPEAGPVEETPIDPRNGSPRPRPELKVRPRI